MSVNIQVTVPWSKLSGSGLALRYTQAHGNYYIFATTVVGDDTFEYTCVLPEEGADASDFSDNYKQDATPI